MVLDSPPRWSAAAPSARGSKCCRDRWRIGAVAAGMLLLASAGHAWAAAAGILHLRCSNPASGASWPIVVDLEHGKVDSLPAKIGEKWISWHDPKAGFFELERATGGLQLRNASSTGGYFLHYLCRPD